MPTENLLEIAFENCEPGEALRLANELEQDLREAEAIEVSRKKDRADSQDFGATLVVLFGTPVAIALAKAVGVFLQRHSGASIRISKDGSVIAANLESKDAARIAEAFAAKKKRD
jgi:hypothetical protein